MFDVNLDDIVDTPANKARFQEHIERVVTAAREYKQYLDACANEEAVMNIEDLRMEPLGKEFFHIKASQWTHGCCVYFRDDDVRLGFYWKPKPDPLAYLKNICLRTRATVADSPEEMDSKCVFLACIHDYQWSKDGQGGMFFNLENRNTLEWRICRAVWHTFDDESKKKCNNYAPEQIINKIIKDIRRKFGNVLSGKTAPVQEVRKKRGRPKDGDIANRNRDIRKFKESNPLVAWQVIGKKFGVSAEVARKACPPSPKFD